MTTRNIRADITGTVIAIEKRQGDAVAADEIILFMESMKMEMPITAPVAGTLALLAVAEGDTVNEGQVLAAIEA